MKFGPLFAVLLALICAIDISVAEPKQSEVNAIPAGVRINPRFYGRSNQKSSSSEDAVVEDESDDEDTTEEDDEDKEIEAYYSVSDTKGQTYLIPENVLQAMADKQSNNDDSETVLVPNGSVDLDDDDSEDSDSSSALVMNQDLQDDDDNELQPSPQFITIVNDSEGNGKSPWRVGRRRGAVRRRAGGRRNRRTRGGSRQGLIRRVTRRRIRRGGGARGGRRGGRRGSRVRLGRVRLKPARRGVRFGF